MSNFHRLAAGVDVAPLLAACMSRPKLWNENRLRLDFDDSPHRDVDDIWLRFNKEATLEKCGDDLEAVNYPAWDLLPQARPLIFNLMRFVEAERLGRVMITKLARNKAITSHKDVLGAYANYYTRYHIVLQGLPKSFFRCGEEEVEMRTGEIWWFNAHDWHEVLNHSASDRVHLLVDVRIPQ